MTTLYAFLFSNQSRKYASLTVVIVMGFLGFFITYLHSRPGFQDALILSLTIGFLILLVFLVFAHLHEHSRTLVIVLGDKIVSAFETLGILGGHPLGRLLVIDLVIFVVIVLSISAASLAIGWFGFLLASLRDPAWLMSAFGLLVLLAYHARRRPYEIIDEAGQGRRLYEHLREHVQLALAMSLKVIGPTSEISLQLMAILNKVVHGLYGGGGRRPGPHD